MSCPCSNAAICWCGTTRTCATCRRHGCAAYYARQPSRRDAAAAILATMGVAVIVALMFVLAVLAAPPQNEAEPGAHQTGLDQMRPVPGGLNDTQHIHPL